MGYRALPVSAHSASLTSYLDCKGQPAVTTRVVALTSCGAKCKVYSFFNNRIQQSLVPKSQWWTQTFTVTSSLFADSVTSAKPSERVAGAASSNSS